MKNDLSYDSLTNEIAEVVQEKSLLRVKCPITDIRYIYLYIIYIYIYINMDFFYISPS